MNTDNRIGLISVADLKGYRFVIPGYQRGYRWEKQQVTDLLKDLMAFINGGSSGYYCLQPLAVKKVLPDMDILRCKVDKAFYGNKELVVERMTQALADSVSWEVIDGQQRLTTIYILIRLLDSTAEEPYSIFYKTRKNSSKFLREIGVEGNAEADTNIDFFHMQNAYYAASKWLDDNAPDEKATLLDVIKNRVKFIWYESINEKPIEVFTRLNIGKISLTNAELIKATLLNRSNYPDETSDSFRRLQLEIASKWDRIEYALQNEEFWLFLNSPSYIKPTRIDFFFEMVFSQDSFKLKETMGQDTYNEVVGNDRYSVFRYFATATSNHEGEKSMSKHLRDIWDAVDKVFGTFVEWFNDKFYFHYIGYLIWDCEEKGNEKFPLLEKLYGLWNKNDKECFKKEIVKLIKKTIIPHVTDVNDLNKLDFDEDKAVIKRVLLLHNIQDIIDNQEVQTDKYELNVFYKFPFHIFKKEVWNVEHIDSATTNELKSTKEQKAWARAALYALKKVNVTSREMNRKLKVLRIKLEDIIKLRDKDKCDCFHDVFDEVDSLISSGKKLETPKEGDAEQDNERNHPWNLALLDEGTNKSYKNSIFSVKRAFIIYKERGLHCHLDDDGQVKTDEARAIAFVPPCTKQAFMKYYNPDPTDLLNWGKKDAEAYLKDIKEKLGPFLS